jgi:predicted ATPase
VKLQRLLIDHYRSFEVLDFEAGPFTVLFGKNNVGKTNILEAIYGVFAPEDEGAIRGPDDMVPPQGAATVQLEQAAQFDREASETIHCFNTLLPPDQVAFVGSWRGIGMLTDDPVKYLGDFAEVVNSGYFLPEDGWLQPLMVDWEIRDVHVRIEAAVASLVANRSVDHDFGLESPWIEAVDENEEFPKYRIKPMVYNVAGQLAALATDLLPDFVDGEVDVLVNTPEYWERRLFHPSGKIEKATRVLLEFRQRGSSEYQILVEGAGRGVARWITASAQVALRLMEKFPTLTTLRELDPAAKPFAGYVLLVDEPEAHLHPTAVASIVRWCTRMVDYGFTVITASHHEEFLRVPSEKATLVHITRNPAAKTGRTTARTLTSATTDTLQEIAADIGMHPAAILSLNRAVLFVEGTLDDAALDEYAGMQLDQAGVKIIPIHGTKNLEGLITAELAIGLGIKIGVLTDATNPVTFQQMPRRKLSSEERKVLKLIELANDRGLEPPKVFGIPEDDLLFALPSDAIRRLYSDSFPGWKELRTECREALGKGPSDSVDWKTYAQDKYRIPITDPSGVRQVVRRLDLAGVPIPSIRTLIDAIVLWAQE